MMNELLEELVKNQLLSEETQKQLKEAFEKQLTDAIEDAKKAAEEVTKVELTEKWITERDQLIEALDRKVDDVLKAELAELKEDIEKFRDLEVEYAEKIAEHKAAMAEEVKTDMVELLEKLDTFLEVRITSELEELKESIEDVRKLDFGRRIFEAFAEEFDSAYIDEDSIKAELADTKAKLAETVEALEEVLADREAMERNAKMDELLSSLDAHQREVMETLLDKVASDKLEEAYKVFLPRIIKESTSTSEKETEKVLAEGAEEVMENKYVSITGDKPLNESEKEETSNKSRLSEAAKSMLQKLGGIK